MKVKYFLFFFVFFTLCFTACDSFSKDSGELAKELDELIVWNNAKDLDVTVLVESREQGQIVYEAEKKKQGYAFQLKFLMEKNYPGSFDHWAAFEEYTPGRTDNEITDFNIIEFKDIADSSYKVVDVIVKDSSKKYTIVPLCSENPIVKTQVEQKYKGQVSITGPSNVELGVPYDVKLETNALYGFNDWEFYTKNQEDQKQPVSVYKSDNIAVTPEEQESEAYKTADAAIFRVIKTVEQGYTTVSMKFVLLKDKRTDFYIEGKLYELPTISVSNENLSSVKIGTAQSKVSSVTLKVNPEKLSGNEIFYDFEAKPASGLGIAETGAFQITDSSSNIISPVLITDKFFTDEIRASDEFKNAKLVITEQNMDGDGILSGKILLRDCLDVNIGIKTYALPKIWVSNSVEGVITEPSGGQNLRVNQSFELIATEKPGYELMGFDVMDSEGTKVTDVRNKSANDPKIKIYASSIEIEEVDKAKQKYKVTLLKEGADYSIVPNVVPRQSFLSYTPADGKLAQTDSIVITFSQDFNQTAITNTGNKIQIRVYNSSNVTLKSSTYFSGPEYNGCDVKFQNIKKLEAGYTVDVELQKGIEAANGSHTNTERKISFKVTSVSDNTPPEIKNPVLYYHLVPSVQSYKRTDKCGSIEPEEFSVDKINVSDTSNTDSSHIKNVNIYKESYAGMNTVNNTVISGLEDNHFVVSFSADDTATGGSNIKSISLTEKVVYFPENMVIPKTISSIKNSNYQKVPAGGYYVDNLISSKYFSGTNDNIQKFISCSYDIPFTADKKVDVSYPFSSKLSVGGIHEFTLTVKDSTCSTTTVKKFYVNFSGEKKVVNTRNTGSFGTHTFDWYSYLGVVPYKTEKKTGVIHYQVYPDKFQIQNRYVHTVSNSSNEFIYMGFSFENFYELYKDQSRPHIMVVENASDNFEFVNKNSTFIGTSLLSSYINMVGNDKRYEASVFYYRNEQYPDFPEDGYAEGYNKNDIYYKYSPDFYCKYVPKFMNENDLFNYNVYEIDSYGTPSLLKENIPIKSKKYCIGDIVFWNKNVNSIFVKSYQELETLDTVAVPFAVIAYVDDDFIYGVPFENPDSNCCWAVAENNPKYNIYIDEMAQVDSTDCRGIQDKLIEEIGVANLSKFPALNYVSKFGAEKIGFNPKSTNEKIKKLSSEWLLPTANVIRKIREQKSPIDKSFQVFDKTFWKLGTSFWLSTYGIRSTTSASDDSDRTKMAYFDNGWGGERFVSRSDAIDTTNYMSAPIYVYPIFDFTSILE